MLPDVLLEMAASLDLFHTATGVAYADLRIEGHRETWPVRSRRLRGWLRRHYYEETGEALAAAAVRSALDLMEARAQFDAPERSVHVRVATHADRLYLDLADECWRAVEIRTEGWRVIEAPPVRFRRPEGMLPLPEPRPGGPSKPFAPCSTSPTVTTSCLWWLGFWRACGRSGPIRCWRSQVSRARPRPCCRSCSGP